MASESVFCATSQTLFYAIIQILPATPKGKRRKGDGKMEEIPMEEVNEKDLSMDEKESWLFADSQILADENIVDFIVTGIKAYKTKNGNVWPVLVLEDEYKTWKCSGWNIRGPKGMNLKNIVGKKISLERSKIDKQKIKLVNFDGKG